MAKTAQKPPLLPGCGLFSGTNAPVALCWWLLLGLALAGCRQGAFGSAGPMVSNDLTLAEALVTTGDLDALRAGVWTADAGDPQGAFGSVRTLNDSLCGLDCAVGVWDAPNAELSVTLMRHESAAGAEAVMAGLATLATAQVGFVEQAGALPVDPQGAFGSVDQAWLGFAQGDALASFELLTRRGPVVVMTVLAVHESEISAEQHQALVLIAADVAAAQWEKLPE